MTSDFIYTSLFSPVAEATAEKTESPYPELTGRGKRMKVFEIRKVEEMFAERHELGERCGICIRQAVDNATVRMNENM